MYFSTLSNESFIKAFIFPPDRHPELNKSNHPAILIFCLKTFHKMAKQIFEKIIQVTFGFTVFNFKFSIYVDEKTERDDDDAQKG